MLRAQLGEGREEPEEGRGLRLRSISYGPVAWCWVSFVFTGIAAAAGTNIPPSRCTLHTGITALTYASYSRSVRWMDGS